jgi:hypothetical protein
MDDREIVYKILYRAFVDFRYHFHSMPESMYYKISNVLHNVPLQLMLSSNSDNYSKILRDIEHRAIENGVKQWLDVAIRDIGGKNSQ